MIAPTLASPPLPKIGLVRMANPAPLSTRKRILVVEHEPETRVAICTALERAGYPVAAAGSRRDTLWGLRSVPRTPGLILLDPDMPDLNGVEFREQQHQAEAWARVPVILLADNDADAADVHALGALGALRKPLDIARLMYWVHSVCRPERAAHCG